MHRHCPRTHPPCTATALEAHCGAPGEQRGCLGSLFLSSVVLVTHSRCRSDGDGRTEESSGVQERITPHRGSGVVPSRLQLHSQWHPEWCGVVLGSVV